MPTINARRLVQCAQLDEPAFAAAWAEGRAMSLEQAVAYALEGTSTAEVLND